MEADAKRQRFKL